MSHDQVVTQDITKDLPSIAVGIAVSSQSSQVIRGASWIPSSGEININLRANIIVSDQHHPFCTPTKHNLVKQNPKTETFPKSTYASGDDGIPSESQKGNYKIGI